MKKLLPILSAVIFVATACKKTTEHPTTPTGPRTEVPNEIRGNWMFGNFSMTEYWSQDPYEYLGNGLELAFAFTFNADGTYTQYFTSSSVINGATTYQQSVTKGTLEVDAENKIIKTNPYTSHYKRTQSGRIVEEKDMPNDKLTPSTYYYERGMETSGSQALYLRLESTEDPLT